MREHNTWRPFDKKGDKTFPSTKVFFLSHNCVSSASVHVGAVCSVLLELRCVQFVQFISIFCKNTRCTLFGAVGFSDFWESISKKNIVYKKILLQKNIEYNELKAWLAQARQQAASTTASQMAFDASWKTGHLPLEQEWWILASPAASSFQVARYYETSRISDHRDSRPFTGDRKHVLVIKGNVTTMVAPVKGPSPVGWFGCHDLSTFQPNEWRKGRP